MDILVAGGAGYTGSVISDSLIEHGHVPIIVDSLRLGAGRVANGAKLYAGDISNYKLIKQIFTENNEIGLCINCAEISSQTMSVTEPYAYYYGNVVKTMDFFKYLNDFGCNKIIYCSSAAVYDEVPGQVVTERSPVVPVTPFGRAKYMAEIILRDFCGAYNMSGIVFRTFNALGAGFSEPLPTRAEAVRPNSILGKLLRVMDGELPHFEISGDDWDTRDGTCIRDYVHVCDMARAYAKAVEAFDDVIAAAGGERYSVINIGNGYGITVKEFISAFENVTGEKIKTILGPRRKGDISGVYANIKKAERVLNWKPELPVEEAIIGALGLS